MQDGQSGSSEDIPSFDRIRAREREKREDSQPSGTRVLLRYQRNHLESDLRPLPNWSQRPMPRILSPQRPGR